jgi:hypothetical protein
MADAHSAKLQTWELTEFDDGAATAKEQEAIAKLRSEVQAELETQLPENASDHKMLRFVRGYRASSSAEGLAEAVDAYKKMVAYRAEHELDTIRAAVVAAGEGDALVWPFQMEEFQPLVDIIGKGLMHELGCDKDGRVLTICMICFFDLKKVIKQKLQPLISRAQMFLDEYWNLKLEYLSEQRGKLVARHDMINVLHLPLTHFDLPSLRLITSITEGSKHYPESVARITSCGNGVVAVTAWGFIKHFVPKHTTKKIRVLGTNFAPELCDFVGAGILPVAMGGFRRYQQFDARWFEPEGGALAASSSAGAGADGRTLISIPARSAHSYTFVLSAARMKLQWNWLLRAHTIKFSAIFLPEVAKEGAEQEEQTPYPVQVYDSAGGSGAGAASDGTGGNRDVYRGEFEAPCAGRLVLHWDNSGSMFRAKQVSAEVTPPGGWAPDPSRQML